MWAYDNTRTPETLGHTAEEPWCHSTIYMLALDSDMCVSDLTPQSSVTCLVAPLKTLSVSEELFRLSGSLRLSLTRVWVCRLSQDSAPQPRLYSGLSNTNSICLRRRAWPVSAIPGFRGCTPTYTRTRLQPRVSVSTVTVTNQPRATGTCHPTIRSRSLKP